MSNPTDNATVTAIATEQEPATESTVEKTTFVQKAKNFVKTHKKSTIAVGGLVGLVGLAAMTGRKADDPTMPSFTEPSPEEIEEAQAVLELESTSPISQEN